MQFHVHSHPLNDHTNLILITMPLFKRTLIHFEEYAPWFNCLWCYQAFCLCMLLFALFPDFSVFIPSSVTTVCWPPDLCLFFLCLLPKDLELFTCFNKLPYLHLHPCSLSFSDSGPKVLHSLLSQKLLKCMLVKRITVAELIVLG